jgi:flagellar hook-associated protein 3 FlgL
MRVTFNSIREDALGAMGREMAKQARLQNQISSGQKISQANEDPLAAQKILSLQSTSAQAQQFHRNAGYALDISKASYNAVDAVRQTSDRAGEIAAGISGLTTPDGFETYATEVNGLIEQAVSAMNRQFDGKYLLGGTKTDTAPYVSTRDGSGNVTSVAYAGAAQGAAFQISEGVAISPYTDGASNGDMRDFVNNLVALRDALESGSATAVNAQRSALQSSEEAVLNTLGRLGAQQGRIERSQEAASNTYDEASARIGAYNGVDLSQAIVELTQSQTAYQAAIQATAKIAANSLLDYI